MPTTTTPFVRAKIIAHSAYPGGPELITAQATGQRFILSELNTHGVLSKNSASSRAIPFPKQVQKILDNLAYPEVWAREQKGMQGGDEIENVEAARGAWELASKQAIEVAQVLANDGVHKSIVNRLLEPFMWHTVVLTATSWQNFFDQRCSPLAQPEIRVMAEAIRTAVENSTPVELSEGEWHLPYVDAQTRGDIAERLDIEDTVVRLDGLPPFDFEARGWETAVKVSAARCARVSYLTQEGKRDIDADLDLYEKLTTAKPQHWSPLEHVATPWRQNRQRVGDGSLSFTGLDGDFYIPHVEHLPRVGKLLGWRALRTEVETMQGVVTHR